jgi:ATP-dependent RNA helicase DDX35
MACCISLHSLDAMEEDVALSSFIPALYKPAALLPIARHRESLLYLVDTFPVTIVVGQTGSGKTTQIPQFLDQAGWCAEGKLVAVTQVRLPCILCNHCAES